MTVDATYPDGTYRFVGNTFQMMAFVHTIQSTDKKCPLKDFDLLTGHLDAKDFQTVKTELEAFELEDEKLENCRIGLISAIDTAIEHDHKFLVFT